MTGCLVLSTGLVLTSPQLVAERAVPDMRKQAWCCLVHTATSQPFHHHHSIRAGPYSVCQGAKHLHACFLAEGRSNDAPVGINVFIYCHLLALALQMKEAADFREVKLKGKNHILKTGHYRLKNELKSDHKKVEQLQEQVAPASPALQAHPDPHFQTLPFSHTISTASWFGCHWMRSHALLDRLSSRI